MKIFQKTFGSNAAAKKKEIPAGLWTKCPKCSHVCYSKILQENDDICPRCEYHFPLDCWTRMKKITDEGSFVEMFKDMESGDPLNFTAIKSYKDKIAEAQKETGLKDAIIAGTAVIDKKNICIAVTDQRFIMGSMGSVLGEKITRIAEEALKQHIPLIIVSGSGGGARMYEGLLSLMQMAKTCGILEKLKAANIPFISILTHPTMAGIMASFAGIGDVTIAEPGALIGFTGPRVIKQTMKQDLPKGFQTSEFNLEHGLIDMVVHRKKLREKISLLLEYLTPEKNK